MSLVEYHDPDNVFDALVKQLAPRLPLTNLHWKSASRPLRSISNLHVDFVSASDKSIENLSTPSLLRDAQQEHHGQDEGAASHRTSGARPQRHQIPGLRQTPYLKLYLLRCDDKETYKSKSRDLVREWMKTNVQSAYRSSSSLPQNDHDAYEWLVLHVVIPDTPAAAEPRWSKKASEQDVPKERSTTAARWPGKGSRTILERLRADFNHTSKSAPDRIAQIRLPQGTLESGQQGSENGQPEEPTQDHERGLNDLISKLKVLILKSFDLRVSQYEEDIQEKEDQKTLPGWNFCTFFVLKEGLAKAFENVGVLEDALLGYDELEIGLDAALRDLAYGQSESHATSFLKFTEDFKAHVSALYRSENRRLEGTQGPSALNQLPLDASKKDYRASIVSSHISIYDIKSYIFANQVDVLLQLTGIPRPPENEDTAATAEEKSASVSVLHRRSSRTGGSVQNIMALADLCRRAVQYIPTIGRILRIDLKNGFGEAASVAEDLDALIDYIVHSHTFAVSQQILDSTAIFETLVQSPTKERDGNSNFQQSESNAHNPPSSLSQTSKEMLDPSPGSRRESWLLTNLNDIEVIQNGEVADIASSRAQMYMIQKRALEAIGTHHGLSVAENNEDITQKEQRPLKSPISRKDSSDEQLWRCPQLHDAIQSPNNFTEKIERLISIAARNFALSNRTRSAEKLIIDLAKLKYYREDYTAALTYFNQVLPSFSGQNWNGIESSTLEIYSKCLKSLQRVEDYIRILLALLSKSAQLRSPSRQLKRYRDIDRTVDNKGSVSKHTEVRSANLLNELVSSSLELPEEFEAPVEPYFINLHLNNDIEVFEDRDGLRMLLNIQQLIAESVTIDEVKVQLINPRDKQSQEVILENREPVDLPTGVVKIQLETLANVTGYFVPSKISLKLGKITFKHDLLQEPSEDKVMSLVRDPSQQRPSDEYTYLLLHQRLDALHADVMLPKTVHVGQVRYFHISLWTGGNDIKHATIMVRPATAGMRIHTAEAKVFDGSVSISDSQKAGQIRLEKLNPNCRTIIQVPYNLEQNLSELAIRLEILYTTLKGQFVFRANPIIPIDLGLDVGVQDFFKREYLYSKFLVQPGSNGPAHILDARMTSSRDFASEPLIQQFQPFIVSQLPIGLTFRITRKAWQGPPKQPAPANTKGMTLTITYTNLQEDLLAQLLSKFFEDFRQSEFAFLESVLEKSTRKAFPSKLASEAFRSASTSIEVELPSLKDLGWLDVVNHLSSEQSGRLFQWLQTWREQNSPLRLLSPSDPDYSSIVTPSKLVLDVSIPQLHYVHTTALRVVQTSSILADNKPGASPPVVRMGEPLQLELKIRQTRRWDQELKIGTREFFYDIQIELSQWLLIGSQSARFTLSSEEDEYTDIISLIPLQTGTLFLPSVDVKLARSLAKQTSPAGQEGRRASRGDENTSTDAGAAEGEEETSSEIITAREALQANDEAEAEGLRCQTDCTSIYTSIVVIAAAQSTTVTVAPSAVDDSSASSGETGLQARLVTSQPWDE